VCVCERERERVYFYIYISRAHTHSLSQTHTTHTGMNVVGEIEGKHCIIVDDMIDTAGTLCKSAETLKDMGAKSVSGQ
jgi:phosphoribosylpyrophosphate synthetase